MKLKYLNDEALLTKTESLIKEERALLTTILIHLREIKSRRLYSSMGFPSMLDYMVKKLGYSEDQSYRRLNAMIQSTDPRSPENCSFPRDGP